MKDFKQQSSKVMQFIKKIIDEIGPRLPASDEERAAAKVIKQEYEDNIGLKPVSEPFKVCPNASIGFIPILGLLALLSLLVMYVYPLAGGIMAAAILFYALTMALVYTSIFDVFWPKKDSENFYTIEQPESGKCDFTILLGAHYDSSWHWPMAHKNPDTFVLKLVYGIVGLIMVIASAFTLVTYNNSLAFWQVFATGNQGWSWQVWFGYIAPIPFIPGLYFLTQFLSYDKKLASPGAMDNLTGVGINMMLAKYYHENKQELPQNCRLITCAFGCEEAGLKGSKAFVKAHAKDGMLDNLYFINLDSISDEDYFEAVKGDIMQLTFFNKAMVQMAYDSLKEVGVIKKSGIIMNPIGGCDSTSFHKKGVPTVTIAAQNPKATTYYHTKDDKPERLKEQVFADCMNAVTLLINKISDYHNKENGSNNR